MLLTISLIVYRVPSCSSLSQRVRIIVATCIHSSFEISIPGCPQYNQLIMFCSPRDLERSTLFQDEIERDPLDGVELIGVAELAVTHDRLRDRITLGLLQMKLGCLLQERQPLRIDCDAS